MEKELTEKMAIYVQRVGADSAIDTAETILSNNSRNIERSNDSDAMMAQLRFQLSVLEYLHCDSEIVDKYMAILQ